MGIIERMDPKSPSKCRDVSWPSLQPLAQNRISLRGLITTRNFLVLIFFTDSVYNYYIPGGILENVYQAELGISTQLTWISEWL